MDIFNYIILFIFVYSFILNVDINSRNTINIIIAFAITYYYYNNKTKSEKKELDKLKKNLLNEKKDNKYKNLKKQNEILRLFNKLKKMRKFNPDTISGSLKHFDNFYKIIGDLRKGMIYSHYHINLANDERKLALNLLSSLIINIPPSENNLREKKLSKVIDNIKEVTQKDLFDVTYTNNNKINSSNMDITKCFVDYKDPQPKNPFFEKNFEIY